MIAYFDASAFVKLIVAEPGTPDAQDLFETATVIQSSWLLVPESSAALARAAREGRLSPSGAVRAWDVLRGLVAQVEALDLDEAVAERAGELAAKLGLRGADAVHL
ncbi:MAG: type II toxin-antitoxin system VapC family toxin, partial [Gaiellaceae bacterium]